MYIKPIFLIFYLESEGLIKDLIGWWEMLQPKRKWSIKIVSLKKEEVLCGVNGDEIGENEGK